MLKRIALELSLKPFRKTDENEIKKVCVRIFTDWYALLKNRAEIDVMLWAGDGSELLDYAGDMEEHFEWAKYIGTANKQLLQSGEDPATSPHFKKQLYIENPPSFTYGILKKIITTLRETAKELYPNAKIYIGETLDIGPEFAVSDFKYHRHKEICSAPNHSGMCFVDSTALLAADNRKYAAFPNGIPADTPFGLFVGKQANVFLREMGFDYLWLSNGLGFSSNPWEQTGKIFDGENFHPERIEKTKAAVFDFWRQFREGCPEYPVRVRGTNNSAGIDYATDGVPLYDIYRADFNITPPPNSPWAAINGDYGLELMGQMTRICELPQQDFLFRFYIHDPWWMNSPWYDRYNGQPSDIYLPFAISRLDEQGKVQAAEQLNLLTIDNSKGDMPESCINEPIPHLLKAEKDAPDSVAPLVWVYPVEEFTTATQAELLAEMYYGDRFIADAVNNGFPLCCVVSSGNFLKHPLSLYENRVLITPYQPTLAVRQRLEQFCAAGGRVIAYGSAAYLQQMPTANRVEYSDFSALQQALDECGYTVALKAKTKDDKKLALAVSRADNAFWFSVYNPHATTDTHLCFPLGAPILLGGETEIVDGCSVYRFARSEHRECRIFVRQNGGIVSALEAAPVNCKYRRKIHLSGLQNATVAIFPESECARDLLVSFIGSFCDDSPHPDPDWKRIDSPEGTYYTAQNISGERDIFLPFPEKIQEMIL